MTIINADKSNVATEGSVIQIGKNNTTKTNNNTQITFSKGKWFGAGMFTGIISSLIATLIFEFYLKVRILDFIQLFSHAVK